MSDHDDIQNFWSPSQELSNDVLFIGLSENFRISTCLRFHVWDGIISLQRIQSWWYSKSVIFKSRPIQWRITCTFILKFYNLYMFKVWGLRWMKTKWHV